MDDKVLFNPDNNPNPTDPNAPQDPASLPQAGQPPVDPNALQPQTPASDQPQPSYPAGSWQNNPSQAVPEQPQEPVAEQAPYDPNAPIDPNAPVDPSLDPNAQATTDEYGNPIVADASTDGTDAGYEEPPPGFFHSSLFKKIVIGLGVLVLIIIIISVVGSLGGSKEKNVTLQWWGLWEDKATMQVLIDDFKKTHPNINVVYEKKSPKQYREEVMTRIEKGTGPDVFRYHNTWLPMLEKNISPLTTEAIAPEEFKNVYYPVMQNDLVKNGAIYGIPLGADSLQLFVNPQLFAAEGQDVPTTWDQFNDAAKALTSKSPDGKILKAGAALGTYDNVNHAPDIISLLLVQQQVDMNKLTDFTKQEAGALSYYGSFALDEDNIWDKTLPNSLLAFAKGDLAMYFGFSWDIYEIRKLNSNLQFKVYPIPSNQGVQTTIASYWVEGVSAQSPNQAEAMIFMNYLAQKETAQKFYTESAKARGPGGFGEPYARKDLQESLSDNELVYPFVKGLDQAASSFFASNTGDGDTGINSLMNNYLKTAVDKLVPGADAGQSVVEDLNNGVAEVLANYVQE